MKDIRRVPVKFGSYAISIGYRGGHAHVGIERGTYLELKSYLLDLALLRPKAVLEGMFWSLPFEAYAPVRRFGRGFERPKDPPPKRRKRQVIPTASVPIARRSRRRQPSWCPRRALITSIAVGNSEMKTMARITLSKLCRINEMPPNS